MQLWYSLVNFTFVNKELCLQNNQIKGSIWFKMDVMTKQYNIFIKYNWSCIWTSSINYNLELFPKWPHICTWLKYKVNGISFFSTKRASNVIFNSQLLGLHLQVSNLTCDVTPLFLLIIFPRPSLSSPSAVTCTPLPLKSSSLMAFICKPVTCSRCPPSSVDPFSSMASILDAMLLFSNWAYASNTWVKSLTVITVCIASS